MQGLRITQLRHKSDYNGLFAIIRTAELNLVMGGFSRVRGLRPDAMWNSTVCNLSTGFILEFE